MNAIVNAELCSGCCLCVETCPEVFQMTDDEDLATVIADPEPADAEDTCQQAADDCPEEAISIT